MLKEVLLFLFVLSGVPHVVSVREAFVNMLKGTYISTPNPKVLDSIERLCPHHMMVCSRTTNALDLYEVG
jgi:hypothetical protein